MAMLCVDACCMDSLSGTFGWLLFAFKATKLSCNEFILDLSATWVKFWVGRLLRSFCGLELGWLRGFGTSDLVCWVWSFE